MLSMFQKTNPTAYSKNDSRQKRNLCGYLLQNTNVTALHSLTKLNTLILLQKKQMTVILQQPAVSIAQIMKYGRRGNPVNRHCYWHQEQFCRLFIQSHCFVVFVFFWLSSYVFVLCISWPVTQKKIKLTSNWKLFLPVLIILL